MIALPRILRFAASFAMLVERAFYLHHIWRERSAKPHLHRFGHALFPVFSLS